VAAEEKVDWSQCPLVEVNPRVQSGTPVLRGTRMPVSAIVDNFDSGVSVAEISEQFGVSQDRVQAILAYAGAARMKTKSEQLFESFLTANKVQFEKIKEDTSHRPDYLVSIGDVKLVFEMKELAEDENFGVVEDPTKPYIKSHSRTIGDHVRRRIEGARKQIQYGAKQGIPSLLLIYNNLDPVLQMFGTEDMDFETAMYGEYTILLDKSTGQSSERFNGKNQLLQESKNTSFSAVGRLCDRGGKTTVTLFENIFSRIKVPYEQLPPCFEVRRVEVSTEPLSFA
jgi:uncharacterized protein (DUF433 family)